MWKADIGALTHLECALHAMLDAGERQRAGLFHHEADRVRFTLSHGVLRILAGHYLARSPASLSFDVGIFGKPHLSGTDAERLAFNLSHSGTIALLAFAAGGQVGVDVECWSGRLRGPERERIEASVFSEGERRALAQLPSGERRAAFYAVWSRKEAYCKATGAGVSQGLDHVEVSAKPHDARIRSDSTLNGGIAEWHLFDIVPRPGYSAALATDLRAPRLVTMTLGASLVSSIQANER